MANLEKYKNAHSTQLIAPATIINSATVPDTEIQDSAAPARTHGHCAQMAATHDTLTAQAGTAMRQDGQTIVRDARGQKRAMIYFDQRSWFVNTGERGFVAGTGFAVCAQMFGHSLMMVCIHCMLMGLGGFTVRRGGNSTVSSARTHVRWKPMREKIPRSMVSIALRMPTMLA
jgi:hypothetical protein